MTEPEVNRLIDGLGGGGGPVAWDDVTGKPSVFPPSAHTQDISTVNGLQSALDGKQPSGAYETTTQLNTRDTNNRARANHTGTQDASTISGSKTSAFISDFAAAVAALITGKQDTLVSGTSIKTVNGNSLLGSGNLSIGGGSAVRAGHSLMVPAATLFVANSANATALGTQAQVANRTIIAPFVPAYDMTIDQLGVSVSTLLAGANAKAVIFASDSNGRPTTILRETANISAAANATVFASITSLTLTAGTTYWIGVRASGTFTLRTLAVGALPVLSWTNAATPVAQQVLIRTETFANAATDWTYASSQHSNALMPLVLMRVA